MSAVKFAILAVDTALFTVKDGHLCVRLSSVNRLPHYRNAKGLPGGLIDPKETAEDAAARHVRDKALVSDGKVHFEQLYTFSDPKRDPRGRVVAVAYLGLVSWDQLSDEERLDTEDAWWSRISVAGSLAFDHNDILALAVKRLRTRIAYTTLVAKLMSREFTLSELEAVYASILGTRLDKRNFRKKVLKLGILKPLKEKRGRFRPAQLYRFASAKVEEIEVL